MIIVVMGVSGAGKSTIGRLLADQLGWPFYEGDDFHPASNIDKIRKGIPLTDSDRAEWLARLGRLVAGLEHDCRHAVIACSALKRSHREAVAGGSRETEFVYLKGNYPMIRKRIKERKGHFMKADLLESQFEILEEPRRAVVVDGREEPTRIVGMIRKALRV